MPTAARSGTVTVNPKSKIIARMLDRDAGAVIDRDWIAARLARAFALRERLYDAPFYRLVHAEADGLPGVVIDRFGDAAVIQPNAAWAEAMIERSCRGAGRRHRRRDHRQERHRPGARRSKGWPKRRVVLAGALDGPVPVPMNGATYMADLLGGQKTGLFFDQRPNHAFAASLAKGARVLDVFSHVGGFSLAALAGGAASALAVDASAPALELATAGAGAIGIGPTASPPARATPSR